MRERSGGLLTFKRTDLPPQIEPSQFKIGLETIKLANKALSGSFPNYFGDHGYMLRQENVVVVKDRSSAAYHQLNSLDKTHSFRRQLLSEAVSDHPSEVREFSDKEGRAMNITVRDIPGHPIFILESEITDLLNLRAPAEFKRAGLEIGIGHLLIHEALHHFVTEKENIPVDQSSPLFKIAFNYDNNSIGSNPELKPILDQLVEYAATHNPSVRIGATRVALFCDDTDGQRREITESGYDLEESFVEVMTQKATTYLLKYGAKNFPTPVVNAFRDMFEKSFKSMDHYRAANFTSIVMPYIAELGLNSLEEAIPLFMSSELPLLHAELTGGEFYIS